MRLLAPFRALRPPPELAPAIASPPYDVVSSPEARAMAAGNPKSFFRISRPEVDLPPDVDEHSDPVHARGHEALEEFRRKGWLVLDDAPRSRSTGSAWGSTCRPGSWRARAWTPTPAGRSSDTS